MTEHFEQATPAITVLGSGMDASSAGRGELIRSGCQVDRQLKRGFPFSLDLHSFRLAITQNHPLQQRHVTKLS